MWRRSEIGEGGEKGLGLYCERGLITQDTSAQMARTNWGMSGVLIAGVYGRLQASYIHKSPFSTGYALLIITLPARCNASPIR
jgi:hypothetical protein